MMAQARREDFQTLREKAEGEWRDLELTPHPQVRIRLDA
jgi:hypothetical protein